MSEEINIKETAENSSDEIKEEKITEEVPAEEAEKKNASDEEIEKVWGVSLKKIVPQELEYYLEEKAVEGYRLEPIGEVGLFFFQFKPCESHKVKYVVDSTKLDVEMYKETLIKKGWEYMGTSANFHVWRQEYTDKRPDDFTDTYIRGKSTLTLGIIFLIVGLLCLAVAVGSVYGIYLEHQVGIRRNLVLYIIQTVVSIPFIAYFLWAAKNLIAHRNGL